MKGNELTNREYSINRYTAVEKAICNYLQLEIMKLPFQSKRI